MTWCGTRPLRALRIAFFSALAFTGIATSAHDEAVDATAPTRNALVESAASPGDLTLTPEERSLLAQHPVLRLGVEKDWPPIEFIDQNGVYSGVIASHMQHLEAQLGVRFEIVSKDSFTEVLAAFERGEIDVLSALGRTSVREQAMGFTAPYVTFTDGLIVRSEEPYVERLKDFPAGKRLAMVQGYGSNERAASNNPQLVVVPVRTTEEALFAVSTGRADIAVASLASAYYLTQQKGLSNLRVAANFDEFEQSMGMAFSRPLAALVPLFNKALATLSAAEREAMRARWTNVEVDRGVARGTVLQGIGFALLALLVLAAWVLLLLSQQRRGRRLQARAEEAEAQLRAVVEATPALFWTLRMESGRSPQFTFFGNGAASGLVGGTNASKSFTEAAQFMLPEDQQRFRQLVDRHSRTLDGFRFEHQLARSGTTAQWVLMQAVPVPDQRGLVWHGCSIDISERKTLEAALEASRLQLEELAASVPGALWQFKREPDGSQHYSYMSDGIVAITGRTPDETNVLMKDKSFVSVHPDDVDVVRNLMQRLTEKTGIDEARYRLRTAQGGWVWVQVAARAMPAAQDGTLTWNGVTLDATRLHETEEALRFERQRLQDLADNLSGALWRGRLIEGRLRFDYVSEGVYGVSGRRAADIIEGREQPFEHVLPEDRERMMAALQASAASGRPIEIEYSIRSASGSIERLFARAAVRHEDGVPVWTGVLLNVTERHRLQGALADVRTRIEDIAAHFPGAIFQMRREADGLSRYTYVSEGITTLTGRPPRTQDGREVLKDFANIYAEDHEQVRTAIERLVSAGGSAQFDYRILHASGQPRWVHCAITARPQDDGSVLFNGLLLDAEESKRLESELRAASEKAESASRAKSQFLANMSHEIRTPMNAVIGLAHLAMTSETNPAQAERIGKIHRAGKALLKLLNDILEYSRLDAGKFTAVMAPFKLHDLKENLRLFSTPAAEAKGLSFSIECDPDVPLHWVGDATRIQQVLLNLITNAIKFTDAGGVTLRVSACEKPTPCLCFVVRDTGIGMSEEQVQRVFNVFEQGNGDTERRHGGSGLGLSICKELVSALGGTIEVESRLGAGTVFSVALPVQRGSAAAESLMIPDLPQRLARLAAHIDRRETTAARVALQGLRLLLVAQGRDRDVHPLERLLASYDFDAAAIELMRLRASWGQTPGRPSASPP